MKFSSKLFTLATCIVFSTTAVNAQSHKEATDTNPHSIKIGYSDGLTLGGASFWGIGLSDAILGTERSDQRCTGVFSLGYRYSLHRRFKLGMDVGMAKVTSKVKYSGDKAPSVKEKELNLMVLPTAEFVYFKRNLVELYGSAAAGMNFTRHYETGLTEKGKTMAQKDSKFNHEFAYQVNPIGLRVGNNRVGGFVEAGLGFRGFVTAGVSLNF